MNLEYSNKAFWDFVLRGIATVVERNWSVDGVQLYQTRVDIKPGVVEYLDGMVMSITDINPDLVADWDEQPLVTINTENPFIEILFNNDANIGLAAEIEQLLNNMFSQAYGADIMVIETHKKHGLKLLLKRLENRRGFVEGSAHGYSVDDMQQALVDAINAATKTRSGFPNQYYTSSQNHEEVRFMGLSEKPQDKQIDPFARLLSLEVRKERMWIWMKKPEGLPIAKKIYEHIHESLPELPENCYKVFLDHMPVKVESMLRRYTTATLTDLGF